jgi:Putative DNA-binding domain
MKEPWEWTEDDILSLILNKVPESTTLDYKACDALAKTEGKKREISKDVSAFANSAGGTIVYGVTENAAHEPENIDAGYDPGDISGEWLEQVINSNIERRISGVIINTIALPKTHPGKVLYVVYIPESNLAPHMAADDRFYKRFNFQSVAMKEYEVRNLMRQEHYPSREIVCAWRDHVINPLLATLLSEKGYLELRKWTWDESEGRNHGLEIHYISDRVGFSATQEQFLESHFEIHRAMDAHDEAVSALIASCEQLFQAIKESSYVRDVYLKAISSQSLQELKTKYPHDLQHANTDEEILKKLFNFPANQEKHIATFAADVMNRVGETSSHNRSTAPLWNTFREQFLEALDHQPIRDYWTQAEAAREELLRKIEILATLLKKERDELSKQHGIPPEKIQDVHYVYRDYGNPYF